MKDYVYLIKIDSEKNNNRYYKMTRKDDFFKIEYGRVGARPIELVRPLNLWDITIQKKLEEGYVNRTEMVQVHTKKTYAEIQDENVKKLVSDLMNYSKRTIQQSYTVSVEETTKKMIDSARKKLFELSNISDLNQFNHELCGLFQMIPRKMKNVSDMLAFSEKDFTSIIQREQEILDVMNSSVLQNTKLIQSDNSGTILDVLDLSIRLCTDEENKQIIRHLSSESKQYFKQAYRVCNKKTEKNYKKYCEEHDLKTHFYYHGSKNGNYMGIMSEGLKLYPDAPITGKMFGYGLYFAPRAKKSIGYTSIKGSHWARGNSNQAYLAVFKVAYKNAKHVSKHERHMCALNNKSIQPYDALFAHGGIDLINDEIIVYDERQVTIQYLIELQA